MMLTHDPDAQDTEGACIPRVRLTCCWCKGSRVFCHVGDEAFRRYFDGEWACSTWCAIYPLARDFVLLLAAVTLLAFVLVIWGGEAGLP